MIGSGIAARLKPYFKTTPKAGAGAQPAAPAGLPGVQAPAASRPASAALTPSAPVAPAAANPPDAVASGELVARHENLARELAELQWDLGGLVYEMAIRDHFRLDLLVSKAAEQRSVDAELAAVERILRLEQAGAAGSCPSCGSLYSRGAVFCWQCGSTLNPQAQIPVAGRPTQPLAQPPQPAIQPSPAPAQPPVQAPPAPQPANPYAPPTPPAPAPEAVSPPPPGAPNGAPPPVSEPPAVPTTEPPPSGGPQAA